MPLTSPLSCVTVGAIGALLSACSGIPIDSEDTRHYLIIGVGVVSVPQSQPERSVSVHRMQALGVSVSDQPGLKLGIGYASALVTSIPHEVSSTVVEVSNRPFGPIRISAEQDAEDISKIEESGDDTDLLD